MDDPLNAAMDAAIDRIAAAKARGEERDEASLAALLRIEDGQKATLECLARIDGLLAQVVDRGAGGLPPTRPKGAELWTRATIIALIGGITITGWVTTPYWARIAQWLGLP